MDKYCKYLKNMIKVIGISGVFFTGCLIIEEYFNAGALVPAIMVLAVFLVSRVT